MATDEAPSSGPPSEQPTQSSPAGVFEIAKTGRARCRACGETLGKGEPRCGEPMPNPFGDGLTTYWFHPRCAAERRPECFLAACSTMPDALNAAELQVLRPIAEFGVQYPRSARFAAISVAPSGRARCRACRELIEKGDVRIELSMFQEGRFDPVGYLHTLCISDYIGTRMPWQRLANKCLALAEEHTQKLRNCCQQ